MARIVSDILLKPPGYAPVAFIALRNSFGSKPGLYQCVCPWCTESVGKPIESAAFGDLFNALYDLMPRHMDSCSYRKSDKLRVHLVDGTLGMAAGFWEQADG